MLHDEIDLFYCFEIAWKQVDNAVDHRSSQCRAAYTSLSLTNDAADGECSHTNNLVLHKDDECLLSNLFYSLLSLHHFSSGYMILKVPSSTILATFT